MALRRPFARRLGATGTPGTETTNPATDGEASKQTSPWVAARRLIALVLLLGWVALLWISLETRHLHICDDQVARVGNTALVRSCRPLSVTDAPMLAILVIAGVLLLPTDLSVLEIPGVLRLERQLKEQAKRQDDMAAMIHRLEVSQNQNQQVTIKVETVERVAETAVRVGELASQQDEKRQRFDSDAS